MKRKRITVYFFPEEYEEIEARVGAEGMRKAQGGAFRKNLTIHRRLLYLLPYCHDVELLCNKEEPMIRASEALLLGSTMLKPLLSTFESQDHTAGCALGMINRAVGGDGHHHKFKDVFPWMKTTKRVSPCGCGLALNAADTVVHLFDHHYELKCCEKCHWTIERIADWLSFVDPTTAGAESHEDAPRELVTT